MIDAKNKTAEKISAVFIISYSNAYNTIDEDSHKYIFCVFHNPLDYERYARRRSVETFFLFRIVACKYVTLTI